MTELSVSQIPLCSDCNTPLDKANKQQRCSNCRKEVRKQNQKRWYEENKERILTERKARYWSDPETCRAKSRDWHHAHLEQAHAQSRKWRIANPERSRDIKTEWQRKHPDKFKAIQDRYRLRRPEVSRATVLRRRARKHDLPDQYTKDDWKFALEYWGYGCAVCGKQADMWTVIAQDHWIALTDPRSDNPGTVPKNVLPLCHPKRGNTEGYLCCNQSKLNKDADEWLVSRFGKDKARRIRKRIKDYFEVVNQRGN